MTRPSRVSRLIARKWGLLLAQSAAVAAPTIAWGGAAFSSGSLTWSWDADTSSTLGGKTTFAITPPSSSTIGNTAFQLDRTGTSGASTATGKGSVGYVANSTTASFSFRSGTGVAQNDAGNVFTGATVTKVQFGGYFDVTGASFGPTATGYFTMSVGGVAGAGGYARVEGNLSFLLNGPGGSALRSPISFADQFNAGGSALSYSKTYIYSSALSPSTLTPGNKVFVSGTVAFIASNLLSPSDVQPIQFEAAAAPPTATFFGDQGVGWADPLSWAPPPDVFVEPGANIPPVPNGTGTRARFVDVGQSGPRTILVNDLITLGALHVDDDDPLTIQSFDANVLRFDHTVDSATLFVGNPQGTGGVTFDTVVSLTDSLDVRLHGNMAAAMTSRVANDVTFNEPITSAFSPGGFGGVRIDGPGGVTYNSPNDYAGMTMVGDGAKLDAFAPGALSTGSVLAQRGMIILSNANAQVDPAVGIDATDAGQIDINVNTVGSLSVFRVGPTAVISGSGAELEQLTIGSNLLIQPGGVIGHESFDAGAAGNPGNLPLEPTYIFGISADFNSGSITVGSNAAGPWRGFGSDRLIRSFGDNPTQPDGPTVIVAGNAEFVAGERLVFNGRLQNQDGASSVSVLGRGGTVEIAGLFNPFTGDINVTDAATLRVNGALPAVQNVLVNAGGTLGGRGAIGGSVNIADAGILDPGDERTLTDRRIGRLTVNDITFSPNSILRFQVGGDPGAGTLPNVINDQLRVNGDLVLDGELLIEQLQFFDTQAMFALIEFGGAFIDNGLQISPRSQEIFGLPAVQAASIQVVLNPGGGGTVFLVVPEPGSTGMVAGAMVLLCRRRRG